MPVYSFYTKIPFINYRQQNRYGQSPLHIALSKRHWMLAAQILYFIKERQQLDILRYGCNSRCKYPSKNPPPFRSICNNADLTPWQVMLREVKAELHVNESSTVAPLNDPSTPDVTVLCNHIFTHMRKISLPAPPSKASLMAASVERQRRRRSRPAGELRAGLMHLVSAWNACCGAREANELLLADAGSATAAVRNEIVSEFRGMSDEAEKMAFFADTMAFNGGLKLPDALVHDILSAICWRGHRKLFKTVTSALVTPAEVASLPIQRRSTICYADMLNICLLYLCVDSPSPLWIAVYTRDIKLVEAILSLPGRLYDYRSPDGTSAFAVALARKDTRIIRTLLKAGHIQPKAEMLDLAAEILLLEDRTLAELKTCLRDCGVSPPPRRNLAYTSCNMKYVYVRFCI